MAIDPQTLHGLPPAEFVALVKRTSDQQIEADFGGEHREQMLDSVFDKFPQQFRPEQAGDRSARIDFRITGAPDGGSDTYAVVVDDGECRVDKHPSAEPDLSLMMGPARVPQAPHRDRQPRDDVHDGQDQGPRRRRPGRRPLELVPLAVLKARHRARTRLTLTRRRARPW